MTMNSLNHDIISAENHKMCADDTKPDCEPLPLTSKPCSGM